MKRAVLFLAGIALLGRLIFGQDQKPPQIDTETRQAILRSVIRAISDYYVYPDKVPSITEYLNQQAQAGRYEALTNPRDFAGQIAADIRSVHDDKHIRIVFDPKLQADIIKHDSSKEGAAEIAEADLIKDRANNFSFKRIEILPANIGYVEFTGFADLSPESRKTVRAALVFVSHTDALIIDLRNNRGGQGRMSQEILGYFFREKTFAGRNFNRLEGQWSDSYVGSRREITDGLVLDMPVYILTSDRTFSAAEGFAYTLQSLKKATVVGETTRGGAHLSRSFSLGNGFVAFIPYLRGENAVTKTDWEGTGVIPDILVDESRCLTAAQNDILAKKLAAAPDETGKRKIQWLINSLKSKDSSLSVDGREILKFVGRFGEFEVRAEGDRLFFRDANQPNYVPHRLVAVTPTLFQAGNDYQIEFILDQNGACDSIKMYWADGWVEEVKRTK